MVVGYQYGFSANAGRIWANTPQKTFQLSVKEGCGSVSKRSSHKLLTENRKLKTMKRGISYV